MGADPVSAGIGGVGLISSMISQHKQQQIANDQLKLQQAQAQRDQALYNTASPYYGSTLGALAQNAGLVSDGKGGYTQSQSPYELPQQLAQFGAAQDQITGQGRIDDASLAQHFAQQGIGGSTLAAALAQSQRERGNSLIGFRRQLAIQAPEIQQQRLGQLMGSLGPGLGAGQQASNVYGQQAQIAQGQANLYGGQAGGILQNYLTQNALQRYMAQNQGAAGAGGGGAIGNPSNVVLGGAGGLGSNYSLGGGYGVRLPSDF